MKKLLATLFLFAAIGGVAFAETVADAIHAGPASAEVKQVINVTIPPRYALHISNATWNLNLNDPQHITEFCWFVSKDKLRARPLLSSQLHTFLPGTKFGDENFESASGLGYPPIRRNNDGKVTEADKGYLLCRPKEDKVIQRFSNTQYGYKLQVGLRTSGSVTSGFGVFAYSDALDTPGAIEGKQIKVADGNLATIRSATAGTTTGGWADDHIREALFFDGSETAGSYVLELIVTLTNY